MALTEVIIDDSTGVHLIARRSTYQAITFEFLNGASPVNISSLTFEAAVQAHGGNALISLTQSSGITNNGALGTLLLAFTQAQLGIAPDDYVFKAHYTNSLGQRHMLFNGVFTLNDDQWDGQPTTSVNFSTTINGTAVTCNVTLSGGASDAADVTFTPEGGIAATNVQDAIVEAKTDAQAYADGKVTQTITDGVTTTAPSENAVFDALNVLTEVSVTGTIGLTSTAFGKIHICSGTSADYPVTLPTAVGFTGQTISFKGSSSLTRFVTIDGLSSETIDGVANKVIWAREYLVVQSDGTNWRVLTYVFRPLHCLMRLSANQGSVATGLVTPTKVNLDVIVDDPSGRMGVGASTYRINIPRTGYYTVKHVTQYSSITAAATRCFSLIYKSGTLVNGEETGAYAAGVYVSPGGCITVLCTAGEYLELYGMHNVPTTAQTFAGASNPACYMEATEINP